MKKQFSIITSQPNDLLFCWQLRVQLHNLRKYDLSANYTALVWYHTNRQNGDDFKEEWDKLQADYSEATFKFYKDEDGELMNLISRFNYIPLLRPWLLHKYFTEYPGLKDCAFLYMDSDVVFTKQPDLYHLIDDDVCYLSDTKSYIAASYFDSKVKDVLPTKAEAYKDVDVLDNLLKNFGLSRKDAEERENGSGGAQYLLKNIDAQFWMDVMQGCLLVRMQLSHMNRMYFESEDKGFQVWCADMWSVLYNLWKRGYRTKCPPEMDFCWATDAIEKWDKVQIYHDAGASTRPIKEGHMLFHKRDLDYVNNQATPFEKDLSFVSSEYCSKNYVKEIQEADTYRRLASVLRTIKAPIIKTPIQTSIGELTKRV